MLADDVDDDDVEGEAAAASPRTSSISSACTILPKPTRATVNSPKATLRAKRILDVKSRALK